MFSHTINIKFAEAALLLAALCTQRYSVHNICTLSSTPGGVLRGIYWHLIAINAIYFTAGIDMLYGRCIVAFLFFIPQTRGKL